MNRVFIIFLILIPFFFSSCATTQQPDKTPPIFYPEPPESARVQYLTSFNSSEDVGVKKSFFRAFITGQKERIIILDKPYGIAGYNGKIYVCDTNQTVMVIDLEKKTFARLPGAQGIGKLVQPINISIDKNGNKYVSDPVRQQVVMFDKNDFYVKAFGPLEDWKPVDAAEFDGLLYVVDSKKAEINVFDIQSGAFRNAFGQKGEDPLSILGIPTNIAIDSEGVLHVSDTSRFQIVKLDRDGRLKGMIGRLGTHPGAFARPKGIALDRKNRVYAVDAAFNNVQIFDPNGRLLLFFGKGGKTPGDIYLGVKVAIDYDNVKYFQQYADPNFQIEYLLLVTSQFGDRKINVYGFGTEKGKTYPTDEELLKKIEEKKLKARQEKSEKTEDTEKKGN